MSPNNMRVISRRMWLTMRLLAGQTMYWTDAQRGVIESSALDGSGRAVLIDERRSTLTNNKSSVVTPHYYGIALDQRYLYYTDWSRGSV